MPDNPLVQAAQDRYSNLVFGQGVDLTDQYFAANQDQVIFDLGVLFCYIATLEKENERLRAAGSTTTGS